VYCVSVLFIMFDIERVNSSVSLHSLAIRCSTKITKMILSQIHKKLTKVIKL